VNDEHGSLLEAEARLSFLSQEHEQLRGQLRASEQERSLLLRSVTGGGGAVVPVA